MYRNCRTIVTRTGESGFTIQDFAPPMEVPYLRFERYLSISSELSLKQHASISVMKSIWTILCIQHAAFSGREFCNGLFQAFRTSVPCASAVRRRGALPFSPRPSALPSLPAPLVIAFHAHDDECERRFEPHFAVAR